MFLFWGFVKGAALPCQPGPREDIPVPASRRIIIPDPRMLPSRDCGEGIGGGVDTNLRSKGFGVYSQLPGRQGGSAPWPQSHPAGCLPRADLSTELQEKGGVTTPTESTKELSNFRYSRALENSLERKEESRVHHNEHRNHTSSLAGQASS